MFKVNNKDTRSKSATLLWKDCRHCHDVFIDELEFVKPVWRHFWKFWYFSEVALQTCSWEKLLWKYAANLSENNLKRDFNNDIWQLYWNRTSSVWVFSYNLLHIFRTFFLRTPLDGCFFIFHGKSCWYNLSSLEFYDLNLHLPFSSNNINKQLGLISPN